MKNVPEKGNMKEKVEHRAVLPTSSHALSSLDCISPIGKVKERGLAGPFTSTPRVGGTRRSDIIYPLKCSEKFDISEEATSPLDDTNFLGTVQRVSDKMEERNTRECPFDPKVDRSRSMLSPLETHKQMVHDRRVSSTTNLREKREIAWGCVNQAVNAARITDQSKLPTNDTVLGGPIQSSEMNNSILMDVGRRDSSFMEKKMVTRESSDLYVVDDESEVKIVDEILATNGVEFKTQSEPRIITRNTNLPSSSDKENKTEAKNLLAVQDITGTNDTEISVCISNTSSSSVEDLIQSIQGSLIIEKRNDSGTQSVVSVSDDDVIQATDFASSVPCTSQARTSKANGKDFPRMELMMKLQDLQNLKRSVDLSKLPDGGKRLLQQIELVQEKLEKFSSFESDENIAPESTKRKPAISTAELGKGPPVVPCQVMAGGRRLFGGKMTEERINMANAITGQVIAQMHNSLANVPENIKMETPASLRTKLMPHQQEGLTWLLWREKQPSSGGILADDMGLGKTLSMISLIVHAKDQRLKNAEEMERWRGGRTKDNGLIPSKATLIIAPASLIFQWEAEIEKHVRHGYLSRYMFHGPKHKRDRNPRSIANYDVVITTYGIVSSELAKRATKAGSDDESSVSTSEEEKANGEVKQKIPINSSSVLTKIVWNRVILDEAHQIKNRTSLVSKACCRISAKTRWCLTGTPIHNNLWDLYSLIRFLRVAPFDEEAVWKEYILSGHSSSERLNTLVKGLLLRREKNQICVKTNQPIVDLKPKMYEKIDLKLEGLEKEIYDYMFSVSRQQVKELIKTQEEREQELYGIGKNRRSKHDEPLRNPFLGRPRTVRVNDKNRAMTCVLTLLMRLRQACVHFALISQAIDVEAFESVGVDEYENTKALSDCLSNMSLLDEESASTKILRYSRDKEKVEQLFEKHFLSTKIKHLLERIRHALSNGDKCIIVSQWTSLLDIIEYHLKKEQISHTSITGKVPVTDRQNRANSFNELESGPRVLLLSLTAGGMGLNLIGGNHLFLVDLHWNPALEQQACDRIYRMGQKKSVFIHKLVCLGTIEERVLALQQMKQVLAKSVLEGAASKKLSKLTVADLKYLFDLGRPCSDLRKVDAAIALPPMFSSVSTIKDSNNEILNEKNTHE